MTITHPSFGELGENQVIMFDTTLRDGEQSPGFSMTLEEKLRMAEMLRDLGVDVLEAGFAIAMKREDGTAELVPGGHREAVERVAAQADTTTSAGRAGS